MNVKTAVLIFLIFFACSALPQILNAQETNIPAGRSQHAACFDEHNQEMLVFGGKQHYKNINSSTETDNRLWSWKDLRWRVAALDGPSSRDDAKMVYHTREKKTYLIGGRASGTVLDEFWEWNGRSWRLLSKHLAPGKRLHTNICYDPSRNRIVLFGGIRLDSLNHSTFESDIWEWDGTSWKRIEFATGPSPRIAHSMSYSSALRKILIVGGVNEQSQSLPEIWSWDGKVFELLDSNLPSIEEGPGNAICIDRKGEINLLLFGRLKTSAELKNTGTKHTGDTWLWDGNRWKKLALVDQPSLREVHTTVYDVHNDRVILFGGGGRAESNYENPNDVWVFKNNKWKRMSTDP